MKATELCALAATTVETYFTFLTTSASVRR